MYQTYWGNGSLPEPAVTEKATRRQFSAEYKLRILAEASKERGQIGALLRRAENIIEIQKNLRCCLARS